MGKSRALTAALNGAAPSSRLTIEFREIPTWEHFKSVTIASPQWRDWVAGSDLLTLTVDGVDEGLIKIPGFVDALAGLLKTEPVARLQLLLACRSLEWPRSEGQRLLDLWDRTQEPASPPSGLYELCPLRERDVSLAAERYLVADSNSTGETRADAFLRELKRQHLIALGSRPLTLKMLLREFAGGAGAFPASHGELYRRCIRHLLTEHDPARRTRLRHNQLPRLHVSENQRLRIAGRIAALMMLCGRSTVADTQTAVMVGSDLMIPEIATGTEWLGETSFEVSPPLVEAVLETPLFWPKNEGRFGFYHQTFAECLAADYLAPLPFPQLRALLFQRDLHGEHVHPQLGELAAWIACDSPPLLNHLLAQDPEVLLRSDVSKVPDHVKAALVDALMGKARAEELLDNDGLSHFLHTLRHPGLARQLRRTFHDCFYPLIAMTNGDS